MNEPFSSYNDAELWNAFRGGDDKAYEYIYHRYSIELFSYGCHIINDRQLIEDCMHDLFVYMFQRRTTLGETNAIKYYLFKSLRRRILEVLERQKRDATPENVIQQTVSSSSPEAMIIEEETHDYRNKRLITAVDALPKRQREAIYLLYFSNLSYPEIAEIMALSVRTVYNQVHTAVQTLRKQLKKHELLPLPAFLE